MKPVINLSVASYGDVVGRDYQLAVLPWGATEPHNTHLPYLTDAILAQEISLEAARLAQQSGVNCMVMPPVFYGSQNPGQRGLKFCVHARYETQKYILTDIVESLYSQGMRRMVIINGHGGNNFKNMIRDLACDYPDFHIATTEWYSIVKDVSVFDNVGDHADEVETSVMLHYHPELVDMTTAGEGSHKPFAIDGLNRKVAWLPRNWQAVSTDTGIGDPRKATAEKGLTYSAMVVGELAQFFIDFATKDIYL